MKIAVEGCAHGELETIYETIKITEERENLKIDLLICCGDFQSTRNVQDLKCMAVPVKYQNLGSFYQYYSGEKKAPILTIFIGGNHEASNYLQELPYGGWVAPNIFYMGYSGVVNINGLRIAGLSGIHKNHDYVKGRYEIIPYNNNSIRSVYHIRQLDVFRLKQLSNKIDVFVSHEWPTGICDFGNVVKLIKNKPFLKDDIESGKLGNKPCEELLKELKPSFWFSAHLHCKFAALVPHSNDEELTKFLALDKCIPRRKFLQILEIPSKSSQEIKLSYDLEWLSILYLTDHLLQVNNSNNFLPGPTSKERWKFTPTELEKDNIMKMFNNCLVIPENFTKTALYQKEIDESITKVYPKLNVNPQTTYFCEKLKISDPVDVILNKMNNKTTSVEIKIDEEKTNQEDMIKRKLILPEPINQDCDLNESISEVDSSQNITEENDISISLIEDSGDNLDICYNVKIKKFKRRNASIYDSNNED